MSGIKQIQAAALVFATAGLMGAAPAAEIGAVRSLSASVSCLPNGASPAGYGTGSCVVSATGGTGIYSYAWEPEAERISGNRARIPCTLENYQNVIVTVTDSNGATATATTTFYCGGGA